MDIANLVLLAAGGMITACGGWLIAMAIEGGAPITGLDFDDDAGTRGR